MKQKALDLGLKERVEPRALEDSTSRGSSVNKVTPVGQTGTYPQKANMPPLAQAAPYRIHVGAERQVTPKR